MNAGYGCAEPAARWLSRYEWDWFSSLESEVIPPEKYARGLRVCLTGDAAE